MPFGTPIKLTLYDPETNEERETYSRSFIPWGILKAAIQCQGLNPEIMTPEDIEKINGLVMEFYGNRFTAQELEAGATLEEVMGVLTAIMSRLEGDLPGFGGANPTLPGRQAKAPRKKTAT
jgi:hypothetical protein